MLHLQLLSYIMDVLVPEVALCKTMSAIHQQAEILLTTLLEEGVAERGQRQGQYHIFSTSWRLKA